MSIENWSNYNKWLKENPKEKILFKSSIGEIVIKKQGRHIEVDSDHEEAVSEILEDERYKNCDVWCCGTLNYNVKTN